MTCLKCGRETDQTFCEQCRKVMEKYPVKPGTIILLPKDRRTVTQRKNASHPAVAPEAKIASQKRIILRLSIVIAVLVLLIGAMGCGMYRLITRSRHRPVGQNFSTVTKSTEEPTVDSTAFSEVSEADGGSAHSN